MSNKTANLPTMAPALAKTTGPESNSLKRRTLFAGAGTVGALAATAAVLPLVQPAPVAVAQAKPVSPDGGYQLTDHVTRYYQTARV